ncbi:hypothetical protein KQI63_08595 [bacterium]|nr:hypothetical protein [bacterium]
MDRVNVSFLITAEDNIRLTALAEALHVSEDEVIHQLLAKEYSSWQQEVITGESPDPDEAV